MVPGEGKWMAKNLPTSQDIQAGIGTIGLSPSDPRWKPSGTGEKLYENVASNALATLAAPEAKGGEVATALTNKIIQKIIQNKYTASTLAAVGQTVDPNGPLGTIVGAGLPTAVTSVPRALAKALPNAATGFNAYVDALKNGGGLWGSGKAIAPGIAQQEQAMLLQKAANADPNSSAAQAAQEITQNAQGLDANGYQPLTAGLTNNTGVKAQLGTIGRQNPALMGSVTQNNQAAVSQGLTDATAPVGVTPATPQGTPGSAASGFFANNAAATQQTADQAAQDANSAAVQVSAQPIQGQAALQSNQGSSAAAQAATQQRQVADQAFAASKANVGQCLFQMCPRPPLILIQ